MYILDVEHLGHRYIIHYEFGSESKVLDYIVELVREGRFDWFTASVLSQKLGQHQLTSLKEQVRD